MKYFIAEFFNGKRNISVYRDNCGKWYVENEGVATQKRLNCEEIVRYLANAANRG